ncbi:hypothetical protein ACJX0J_037263, partial [Zea mays]
MYLGLYNFQFMDSMRIITILNLCVWSNLETLFHTTCNKAVDMFEYHMLMNNEEKTAQSRLNKRGVTWGKILLPRGNKENKFECISHGPIFRDLGATVNDRFTGDLYAKKIPQNCL